jgi:hypothetical protein
MSDSMSRSEEMESVNTKIHANGGLRDVHLLLNQCCGEISP